MNCSAKNRRRHPRHRDVRDCDDPCRTWLVVNRCQLAEEIPRIDLPQQDLTAGDRLKLDVNCSAYDEKHIIAGVLIINNPLVTGEPAPGTLGVEKFDIRVIQRAEQTNCS